jgi:hypothetical protein
MKKYRTPIIVCAVVLLTLVVSWFGSSHSVDVQFLKKGSPCSDYTLSVLETDGSSWSIQLDSEGKVTLPLRVRELVSLKVARNDETIYDGIAGFEIGETVIDAYDNDRKVDYHRKYLFGLFNIHKRTPVPRARVTT